MGASRLSPIAKAICYAILILGTVAVVVPTLWMFSTALKNDHEIFTTPPRWIPDEITFDAFLRVWSDYPFVQYFANSLIVVGSATLISVFFSCLAGYGMSRFEFRGRGSFLTFLLLTHMFPSIMLLIPYYKIIQTLGLVNTYFALILTYVTFTLPFCSWMMYGYFKNIPRELDEAAAIDGSSRIRTFFAVVMPLALPGAVATAIFSAITGWNEYIFALVLTQSEDMRTLAVGIGQMVGEYRILWNDLMASSMYAAAPLVLIFLLLQRYLIAGMTAGAVKN
jgi:multiple sugar transport system permease protein